MNKKFFSLLMIAVFFSGFIGTANIAGLGVAPNQLSTAKVAIVYSTGGLGDNSFNDAAKAGINEAITEYGADLTVAEACESACNVADVTAQLNTFAESSEDYDLIIGIGFSSADGVTAAATANSGTNFMIIDSFVDLPNVASITFKEHEGSFLAGALAAMVTTTNTLGFLGGLDIPLINKFGAGFEHGARHIDESINVIVSYSPDPNNPWGDLAGGQSVAETMMEQGADIIFAAAGGTGLGVFTAVEEANDAGTDQFYGIGVDSNQDGLNPGNVLTSMIKRVDVAVKAQIDAVFDGTWVNGLTELGLAEDGVGITEMEFTTAEKNAAYNSEFTNYEKVQDLKAEIVAGDIVVVDNYDDLVALFAEDAETPLPFLASLIAIVSFAAIVRRRKN